MKPAAHIYGSVRHPNPQGGRTLLALCAGCTEKAGIDGRNVRWPEPIRREEVAHCADCGERLSFHTWPLVAA